MISVEHVSKNFAKNEALKDINLRIADAQTTVLIGPSGSGKSTLLRIIIGLIRPDAGLVRIDGETLNSENIRQMRQQIGYVIQEGGLFPHLTARQNVSLMAAYLGWTKKKIGDRVSELAELTKFPVDGLDRYPAQLSGGQNQRVSLMRALMLDPGILLFDEPLGALDPLIRYDLQTDLRAIFRELKKTVVLVTHDISEAAFFGDHIVLIRDGAIVQQGKIRDLTESPATPFVTRFIQAQRTALDNSSGARK